LYDLLRFNTEATDPYLYGNKAVLLEVDQITNTLKFESWVDLPGGHSKFVVRRDPRTGRSVREQQLQRGAVTRTKPSPIAHLFLLFPPTFFKKSSCKEVVNSFIALSTVMPISPTLFCHATQVFNPEQSDLEHFLLGPAKHLKSLRLV
jgi:hypothetical protein